jgi:prepilin-type N-terminal cleavage/methylation domain-containing protein
MRAVTTERINMNVNTSSKSGFSLVEIMIVVAVIGLTAVIAVPNYVRANSVSQKNACINNLYQLRGAIYQWALETKAPTGATVQFTDIRVYLRNSMVCPAGGTSFSDSYTITDTVTQPVCKKVPAGARAHILPLDVVP